MDSALRRLFLSKRSKSKPLVIAVPPQDPFGQTVAYDDLSPGPPPTVGARPLKPSHQKLTPHSIHHHRTKHVGSQEFKYVVHATLNARPRTAPGIRPTDLSELSGLPGGMLSTEDQTFMPSTSMQAAISKVPPTSNGVAVRGPPKYFDLIQAAVSFSNLKAPPQPSLISFDMYNERIADRNSIYGRPPKLPVNEDVARGSSTKHRNNDTASAPTMQPQPPSLYAMRAPGSVRSTAIPGVGGNKCADMPQSFTPFANEIPMQFDPKGMQREDWVGARDCVTPRPRRNSVHFGRKGDDGQANALPQRSATVCEKSSSNIPLATRHSWLEDGRPPSNHKRARTVPTARTQDYVPSSTQFERPAISTSNLAEDDLDRPAAAGRKPLPSVSCDLNTNYRRTASGAGSASMGQTSGSQPRDTSADYVSTRLSSDEPTRKSEENNRHQHERPMLSGNTSLDRTLSATGFRWNGALPSGTLAEGTAQGPRRNPDDEDEDDLEVGIDDLDVGIEGDDDLEVGIDDFEVGIEDAITQWADPVQILRAAVISADGYVYKGGNNIILGKILHHRPSGGFSRTQSTATPADIGDVSVGYGFKGGHDPSASVRKLSPKMPPNFEASLKPLKVGDEGIVTFARCAKSSPNEVAAAASPTVRAQGPAEARPPLGKSKYTHTSPSSERSLLNMRSRTPCPPYPTAATIRNPPAFPPIDTLSAIAQRYTELLPASCSRGTASPVVENVTIDCVHAQVPVSVAPTAVIQRPQSSTIDGVDTLVSRRNGNNRLSGHIDVVQEECESHSDELDHSIAIKREAVCHASPGLQEVRAKRTYDERPNTGRVRASVKADHHRRDMAIDDTNSIVPNAISKQGTALSQTSRFSSHTKFSDQREQKVLNDDLLGEMAKSNFIPTLADLETEAPVRLERRGRTDTDSRRPEGGHSRIGSVVSGISGTSAYSLPQDMLPVRNSSINHHLNSLVDSVYSSKPHVAEMSWG